MHHAFYRSTPEVLEAAKKSLQEMMGNQSRQAGGAGGGTAEKEVSVRKLADMSRTLKECVSEILDEREKVATHRVKMAKSFKAFVLEGDLDAGLRLLADSDEVQAKHAKKLQALAASQGGGADADDGDAEKDPFELAADDAWIIANKVRACVRAWVPACVWLQWRGGCWGLLVTARSALTVCVSITLLCPTVIV